MKAELRAKPHTVLHGHLVIEVWYGGELIASVVGADGPGVRVITKHQLVTAVARDELLTVLEVQVTR